jgi:hypothetical protein
MIRSMATADTRSATLASLRDLLEAKQVFGRGEWSELWESRMESQLLALEKRERFTAVKERIAGLYRGQQRQDVERYLEYLVWVLENGNDELPAPLLEGIAAEREVWLAAIKPGYERLTELLKELLRLEKQEEGAQIARDRAMRAFDDAYGDARRMLEATFSFAGLAERLARGLRSYVERRRVIREARRKREARAEGRVTRTWRSALSSVRNWVGREVA